MEKASAELFPGTEQFEVQALLGTGGFGTVYKAHDRNAGQTVALKVLHRREPQALLRFKNEFRALRDIHHPNLVTLFELHQHENDWFFTMEYIEGTRFHEHVVSLSGGTRALPPGLLSSLGTTSQPQLAGASLLEKGPTLSESDLLPRTRNLTPRAPVPLVPHEPAQPIASIGDYNDEVVRSVFLQLAEGIHGLHQTQKLHCDIKPSNVIVEEGGRVVLLDFGLVKSFGPISGGQRATATTAVIGTPKFMAPEVCAEEEPTTASDWYSFGVMLYLALTGTVPFKGTVMNMILSKQTLDATPASELVVGLDPDIDHLCTALLHRNPSERPGYPEIARVLQGGHVETLPQLTSPQTPFVGRAHELEVLGRAFMTPEPSVVLIGGLSGYGKSALVEHFLQTLSEDAWALQSRCYERGTVPYKALDGAIDALAQHLRILTAREWKAICPTHMWALAKLFPVLGGLPFAIPSDASTLEASVVRRWAYSALRELLRTLGHGVVLIIDDLQWADEESVGLLAELVQPVSGSPPPTTLLALYRNDDSSPTLRRLLGLLAGAVHVYTLELGPLPSEALQALASSMLGEAADEADIAKLISASEGSPLFLDELARRVSLGRAPEALSSMILHRVEALPESAQRYLELISVAGQPVPEALVAHALQHQGTDLKQILALRQQRLLRTTATDDVAPYHDRIRETLMRHLAPDARREAHQTLAQAAIDSDYAAHDPEFVVMHFESAGATQRAAEYAVPAAERAFDTLAFDRAAIHFAKAIQHLGDPEGVLSARRAESLKNAGHGPRAAQAYLEAARRTKNVQEARRLRIAAVEQYLFAGAYDAGEAVIREVLGSLGLEVAGSTPAAFAAFGWQSLKLKRRGQTYTLRSEDEIKASVLHTLEILWSATIGLAMANPIASQAIQKRHLIATLDAGEPRRLARALSIELAFSGIPGGADERLSEELSQRGHTLADLVGDRYSKAFMTMSDGAVHWLRGRWNAAEEAVESSLAVYLEHCKGVTWEIDTARFVALSTRAHKGQIREIRERLPAYLLDAEERGDLYIETQLRTRFSPLIALADDNPEDAIKSLARAIGHWTAQGYHIVHFWSLVSHTLALLYQGRGAEAARYLGEHEKALWRSLMLTGQYYRVQYHDLRVRTTVAAAHAAGENTLKGRLLLARAEFHARKLCREDLPWALPHGALGKALIARARGEREAAIGHLDEAAEGFDAVDMHLRAVVARYRRAELSGEETSAFAEVLRVQTVKRPERFCAMWG